MHSFIAVSVAIVVSVCPFILSACATPAPAPFQEDDVHATLVISDQQLEQSSHYDYNPGKMMRDGEGPGKYIVNAIIFPFYSAIKLGTNWAQGLQITVWPVNYPERFRQKVNPGENSIRLPKAFAEHGGNLKFEVRGSRSGSWMTYYDPGKIGKILQIISNSDDSSTNPPAD